MIRTVAVLCSLLTLLLVTLAGTRIPDSHSPAPVDEVAATSRHAVEDPPPLPPRSTEGGYADELPRIPPKTLDEALASFQLRPGFRIERIAAEPLLRDPVALDIDENGRMYVAEFA